MTEPPLIEDEEITKHELPDGDYDITGLLQAQRDADAEYYEGKMKETKRETLKGVFIGGMMEKRIEELVERVFKILDKNYIGDDNEDASREHHQQVIKQILSHPDLALIDRTVEYPSKSLLMMGYLPATPLAEALKK